MPLLLDLFAHHPSVGDAVFLILIVDLRLLSQTLIDVFLSYVLNVFYQGCLIFIKLSCMQFSRYNQRLIHLTSRLNYLQAYGLKWTFAHNSQLYSIGSGSVKPMGLSGLEPPTSRLSGVRSNQLSYKPILKSFDFSGDEEIRTLDPLLARQVLSQLSYIPI